MDEQNNINVDVHFESTDVDAKVLAWIGVAIVVIAILLQLFLYLFYMRIKNAVATSPQTPGSVGRQHVASDKPQLQVNPAADMNQMIERENHQLDSYGWVNREQGIVRIPIKSAMKLLAERGLPKLASDTPATNNTSKAPDVRLTKGK